MRLADTLRRAPLSYVAMTFALGCTDAATTTPAGVGITTRDSAGIEIVEHTIPADGVPTAFRFADSARLVIGRTDSDARAAFGSVTGATLMKDGRIAIVDASASELRFFDPTGRFLQTVGRKGQGPGEFMRIEGIVRTAGDSIVLGDPRLERVTIFTPQGAVHGSVQLARPASGSSLSFRGRFGNGTLLATSTTARDFDAPEGHTHDSATYYRVSADGSRADSIARLPAREVLITKTRTATTFSMRTQSVPFTGAAGLAMTDDGFYYTDSRAFSISRYTSNGKLTRIIRLDRAPDPVTDADKAKYRSDRVAAAAPELRPDIERDLQALPFPAAHPAVGALRVDQPGRVWVRERLVDDRPPRWLVFGTTGRLLGSATMPKGCTPLEIGEDHLLCSLLDDDDVPRVELFEMASAKR